MENEGIIPVCRTETEEERREREQDERLVRLINLALDGRAEDARIDRKIHADHHIIVAKWIEREEKAKERWDIFRKSMLGAIAVAIVTGIGKALVVLGTLVAAGWASQPHGPGGPHP